MTSALHDTCTGLQVHGAGQHTHSSQKVILKCMSGVVVVDTSALAVCRLYQTHLKESQEKMRSKAAAAKQAASQPSKAGNQREAGLRAAMMSPLSSNLGKHQAPDQSGRVSLTPTGEAFLCTARGAFRVCILILLRSVHQQHLLDLNTLHGKHSGLCTNQSWLLMVGTMISKTVQDCCCQSIGHATPQHAYAQSGNCWFTCHMHDGLGMQRPLAHKSSLQCIPCCANIQNLPKQVMYILQQQQQQHTG